MLRLLNLFGARSVPQFLEICLGSVVRPFSLLVRRAKLVIFEPDQHLALFHFVALLHSNPFQASGDFGVEVDRVMRHNITRSGQYGATRVVAAGLRRSAHHFNFRRIRGECAVRQRQKPKHDHNRDPRKNVAPGPGGSLPAIVPALRAVNPQTL